MRTVATTLGLAAAGVLVATSEGLDRSRQLLIFGVLLVLFVAALVASWIQRRRKVGLASPAGEHATFAGKLWWAVPFAALVAGLLTFVVMAWLHRERTCEDLLASWNLPPDLCAKQTQLTSLKLGGPVDRVDWLHDGIKKLDLGGSRVANLDDLPEKLEELNLAYARRLIGLRNLPSTLTCLDVRFTGLCRFSRLPENLKVLNLEGATLRQGEEIPYSVTKLTVLGTEYGRLAWLPEKLEKLHLIGISDAPTINVPESVKRLKLTDASRWPRSSLPQNLLPSKLESLTVSGLDLIDSLSLPESLKTLYLTRATIQLSRLPDVDKLGLELVTAAMAQESSEEETDASPEPPLMKLPTNLRTLVLDRTSFYQIAEIPKSVTKLTVPWPGDREPDLPAGLTDLDLSHSTLKTLGKLPDSLQKLTLTGSSIENLGNQSGASLGELIFQFCGDPDFGTPPRKLAKLDLHGCEISRLPKPLENLTRLDIGETDISSPLEIPQSVTELDISQTGITDLAGLPPGLKSLTLHRGQVKSLDGLPETVTELRFVEPGETVASEDD
jgi:Leucine-rich repeat (LRR) protein